MKRVFTIIGITLLAISLFVTGAFAYGGPYGARPRHHFNQMGPGPCYCYNTITTGNTVDVEGTIQDILPGGYTVKLSDGKIVRVGFGPYWYLAKIGLTLKVGDEITMTGVYVNDYFVPVKVTKDGTTYTLRDANGRPLWLNEVWGGNGWKRR